MSKAQVKETSMKFHEKWVCFYGAVNAKRIAFQLHRRLKRTVKRQKTMYLILLLLFLSSIAHAKAITTAQLLDAIETVESNGKANAKGDYHKGYPHDGGFRAIGAYQIWRVYVDDVNSILKRLKLPARYTYNDRLNKSKSRTMTQTYIAWYGRPERIGWTTAETYARIHNCGPNGYKKPASEKYWVKIKRELERQHHERL